jgi:hypothetical protein
MPQNQPNPKAAVSNIGGAAMSKAGIAGRMVSILCSRFMGSSFDKDCLSFADSRSEVNPYNIRIIIKSVPRPIEVFDFILLIDYSPLHKTK